MSEEKPFSVHDKRHAAASSEEGKAEQASPAEKQTASAPPINFSTFVLSLSTSAAMNMGGYQDPVSGHVPKNLALAKQSIDILGILKDKTKGNLDTEEARLLDAALYELRMQYIEEMKKGS